MQTTDQTPPESELVSLRGSRPLFPEEVRARVAAGARLVRFEYCASLLFVTLRRQSPVYLTESWQERYLRGIGYSLLALLLGPWCIPWGLIWTPRAIWINLTGAIDETDTVLSWLSNRKSLPPESVNPIFTPTKAEPV